MVAWATPSWGLQAAHPEKFGREQLPLAFLSQIPAVILGTVHKVAGDPPGAVGLGVPGLGAESDGPPGEVAAKSVTAIVQFTAPSLSAVGSLSRT